MNSVLSTARVVRLPALPRRHKYKVLLVLLLVSIVIQTYGLHAGFVGMLSDAFRTVLSVTIFVVVFRGAGERVPAAMLLLATVAIGWARHFTGGSDHDALALAFNVFSDLFILL